MVAMPKHTLKELQNLSSGTEEAKKEEGPTPEELKAQELKEANDKKLEEARAQEKEELALLEAKKEKELSEAKESQKKKQDFKDSQKWFNVFLMNRYKMK